MDNTLWTYSEIGKVYSLQGFNLLNDTKMKDCGLLVPSESDVSAYSLTSALVNKICAYF